MLYTDNESLMYWLETADIYKKLSAVGEHFAFSSLEKASPFIDASYNKVVGKFNDGANCKSIPVFVPLGPKMYSFRIDGKGNTTEKLRAKGIKRGASREIRHQQYIKELQPPAENKLPNHRIGSTLHKIYTIEVGDIAWATFEKHVSD